MTFQHTNKFLTFLGSKNGWFEKLSSISQRQVWGESISPSSLPTPYFKSPLFFIFVENHRATFQLPLNAISHGERFAIVYGGDNTLELVSVVWGVCVSVCVCVLPEGRSSFHFFEAVTEKKASTVYVHFLSPVSNHLFELQSAICQFCF